MWELKIFHEPTAGTVDYREGHFKDNAKIRLEQNNDPVLRNLRARIESESYDETEFTQDYRNKHYLQKLPRIEVQQDVLTRKYYNDTGMISHYQVVLSKQLLDEFLHALHGQIANRPGITKLIQEARQKYYYPSKAKHIRTSLTKCQMCIQNKRINIDLLETDLLKCPEWDLGPENILQMDIFPKRPPTGEYDNIITAILVLLVCLPSYKSHCTSSSKSYHGHFNEAHISAHNNHNWYGAQFNSQVTKEVAAVLNIELKHATTKHAQTIRLLERKNASVKAHLKAATGEFRNNGHKFLPLAVLNHNTTYHATLGCEPTPVFHGWIPHHILDFKLGYNPNPRYQPQTELAEEVQRRIALPHDQTKKNIMQSYLKYKAYYDRKAKAAPLTTQDYCFILNRKAVTQATKKPFREVRWVGPYKVKKILPNINYIVRRLGTNETQLLHRIWLRIYIAQAPLADNFVREADWQKEDTLVAQDELYAHTWDTNFGLSPFDTEHETNGQKEDIVEYEPTSQPEIYCPPSPEIPAVNNEEPQIIRKKAYRKWKSSAHTRNVKKSRKFPKNPLPKIPSQKSSPKNPLPKISRNSRK